MFEVDHRSPNSRARTAISRTDLSRPFKCAIADGLISTETEIFDYGCGRGDDIRRLRALGYQVSGWDPVHQPETQHRRSEVVNLGYVVNVVENLNERCEVLRDAWDLTSHVLIVSARLAMESRTLRGALSFGDGCLTNRGTFQKFFEQRELCNWIDHTLQVAAVPAAPGVFYVFRDAQARSNFIASQYRRRSIAPRLTKSVELYSTYRELLRPLVQFMTDRGRLPFVDELPTASSIIEVFGSLRKASALVKTVTEEERWEGIRRERSQDLLVYLALAQFDGRTSFGHQPLSLQRDVRAFFGTYRRACSEADELLFSLGKSGVVATSCKQSSIGKLTPSALYLHESAIPRVSPVLRLYEGCARGSWGRVEGANIIKLHLDEPIISYLSYPGFDKDPHPTLAYSLSVHLQTFRAKARDYSSSLNRPILHRKELFVAPDYPGHQKFARLTRIEVAKGLYEDSTIIGLEAGWNRILARKGLYFKGHRLLVATRQHSIR